MESGRRRGVLLGAVRREGPSLSPIGVSMTPSVVLENDFYLNQDPKAPRGGSQLRAYKSARTEGAAAL